MQQFLDQIPAIFILIFALLACILICGFIKLGTRRRLRKNITCPVHATPRQVLFEGSTMHGCHWEDILECGVPRQDPTKGRQLTCMRDCLWSPDNNPEHDLP